MEPGKPLASCRPRILPLDKNNLRYSYDGKNLTHTLDIQYNQKEPIPFIGVIQTFHQEMTMTTIKIKGMSCQHCVNSTRKALEAISGISNVRIDLDKGEATFDGKVDLQTVKEAITRIGFEVTQ